MSLQADVPLQGSLWSHTIDEDFRAFHEANPHVYHTLLRLTREAYDRGVERIGVRMLWEVMRWEMTLSTQSRDEFKLNDHYTSRYVRMLMREHPEFAHLFKTRMLRTP